MAETNVIQLGFKVDSPSLPADTFDVVDFKAEEHISQPFFVRLNLASEDPEVDFEEVANQAATFSVFRFGEPLQFHGIVSRFEQGRQIGGKYLYQVDLVPRLWLLSLRYQSRIFQNLKVDEIVKAVLDEAGFKAQEFRFDLNESYPVREYCVQFQETDLSFISRLLEHEGICYYFEYDDAYDIGVLVFSDTTVGQSKPLPGEDVLVYNPGEGLTASDEAVRVFQCREQLSPGKVFLKEYNYRTPDTTLKAEADVHSELPGVQYEHDQNFKDDGEGQRLVKVRKEEIACHLRVMSGESSYPGLRVGFTFQMQKHYRSSYNGDYLLLSVTHSGSQAVALPGGVDGKGDGIYKNEFTCIPASIPYRPPRITPKPRVPGVMTSRTETAGGDYAYIDEDGSYRAKMFFDLSSAGGGEATRPLRMNQPYSGPGYGIHFPNHAGTEMVWACVNGDPDRPIAVGTVPNPSQISPSTSENKFQNVIRTWGKHELSFDDTIGEENIYLFSTKDHVVEITNDESISIGHDRQKVVGNNQKEAIGGSKTIEVAGFHEEKIGGSMTQSVAVGKSETITAAKSLAIGGAYQVSVGAAMNETVGGAKTEEVGAIKAEAVGGNKSELIGGSKSLTTGKSLTIKIGKDQSLTIAGNLNEKVSGKHSAEVAKEYAVNAKEIQLMAEDQIVLKTGSAQIVLKKNGDIQIKGKKIEIKGSGDVIVKGSKVKAN